MTESITTIDPKSYRPQFTNCTSGSDQRSVGRHPRLPVRGHHRECQRRARRGPPHGAALERFVVPLLGARRAERLERADEAGDGADEADERRDVRERPERRDPLRDRRRHLEDGLLERPRHLLLAAVRAREAGADHLGERGGRRGAAELHRPVDVAGQHELLDLLHEGAGVQVQAEREHEDALDDDRDRDGARRDVHEHERAALLEELGQGLDHRGPSGTEVGNARTTCALRPRMDRGFPYQQPVRRSSRVKTCNRESTISISINPPEAVRIPL